MTILHALILGLVEGLTEFLPVSSTAHLLITSRLLSIPTSAFMKMFLVVIQLGAILAIILYYRKSLPQLVSLWKKVLVAFVPAAIIGYIFYQVIKNFFFESFLVIALGLIVGGVVMIFVEKKATPLPVDAMPIATLRTLTLRHSFLIGCAQALAVIPGVSRSAATIISGRLLGYSRESVTLFSFLLGTVTLGAAVSYDLLKTPFIVSNDTMFLLMCGFLTALAFAYFSIHTLMRIVSKYGFAPFGWYRILIGLLLIIFLV
jgi:undecaprenyl-diphosphatase